jgi:hypothetical protein
MASKIPGVAHRPGEQSSGQRARMAGAGAGIVEHVKIAVGTRDGDP